jgi:hypothetical protein
MRFQCVRDFNAFIIFFQVTDLEKKEQQFHEREAERIQREADTKAYMEQVHANVQQYAAQAKMTIEEVRLSAYMEQVDANVQQYAVQAKKTIEEVGTGLLNSCISM